MAAVIQCFCYIFSTPKAKYNIIDLVHSLGPESNSRVRDAKSKQRAKVQRAGALTNRANGDTLSIWHNRPTNYTHAVVLTSGEFVGRKLDL